MVIWKKVQDFSDYEISNLGAVRRGNKQIKLCLNKKGYLRATLNSSGKWKQINVHKLVLESFIGPRPSKMECRHLDGNQTNNKINNLKWGTHTENMRDKIGHGTSMVGEKHPNVKLSDNDVLKIRERLSRGQLQRIIAADFGVSKSTISDIKLGRRRKKNLCLSSAIFDLIDPAL